MQTRSPVGLLMLRGEDKRRPWLDVETVSWLGLTGAREDLGATGEVLTLSVRARDAKSGSEVRVGRMIVSAGSVRPVHVDGVRAIGRLASGTTAEPFAGVPVARRFESYTVSPFQWTAGGRIGQTIGSVASFGAAYALRKQAATKSDEEAGVDLALTPAPWFTAAGRAAFDLVNQGPTDALASISVQKEEVRAEVFTTHRSLGRLLPSTSLFSLLGDHASTSTGTTLRWRAFPRLELLGTGSVQAQGAEVGGQGIARTTLSLDDEWSGYLGLEARRNHLADARWTGVRAIASVPLTRALRAATELELVAPDEPRGRGAMWPWVLGAIAWTSPGGWELATAVEASAGPVYREEIHALARLSYAIGGNAGIAR